MGVAAYHLLSSETRIQKGVAFHSESLGQWQRGIRRIDEDIKQISVRPVRLEYGDYQAALTGTRDQIEFTRGGWSNPLYKHRSELQRISYVLTKSTMPDDEFSSETTVIQRQYWPVLDRAPDSTPIIQTLLTDVDSLTWRYLDRSHNWQEKWPPQTSTSGDTSIANPDTQLPLAIEVTFTSTRWGEIRRLLSLPDYQSSVISGRE